MQSIVKILSLFILCNTVSQAYAFEDKSMLEICDNGLDDDLDGLIDLQDPDCNCTYLEFTSLIPNSSFEQLDCCPSDASQLACASGWFQAHGPLPDLLHNCSNREANFFRPPSPLPDGDGVVGFIDGLYGENNFQEPFWKEYAGVCLEKTLVPGREYQLIFDLGFGEPDDSPPLEFSIFGATSCIGIQNVPIIDGCPLDAPAWQLLGSTVVQSVNGDEWINDTIVFQVDESIGTIALGPPCTFNAVAKTTYYYMDNLILNEGIVFAAEILESGSRCQDDFALYVNYEGSGIIQWYQDSIAIIGQNSDTLLTDFEDANYQVSIIENGECFLSPPYTFQLNPSAIKFSVDICSNETLQFGDQTLDAPGTYLNTFNDKNGCDSTVALTLTISEQDTIYNNLDLIRGEEYVIPTGVINEEGIYSYSINAEEGCDTLAILEVVIVDISVANIISLSATSPNNTFAVYGSESENFQFRIFDRYGSLLANGTSWNGYYNGRPVESGVYIYQIYTTRNDSIQVVKIGTVTVIE